MVTKKSFGFGRLQINMTNRWLYTLITLFAVVVLGVGVYAVAGTTPNPGHPMNQIQPCSDGEILKMGGGAWTCGADVSGSGTGGLWSEGIGGDIYYNGFVGIGTTNPAEELEISSDAPYIRWVETDASNKWWSLGGYQGGIGFYETSSLSFKLYIASGGNVGIGTAMGVTPSAKLEVNGNIIANNILKTYVGVTSNSYTGSQVGGYSGGNAKCVSAFGTGTRMATSTDFVNGLPGVAAGTKAWYSTFEYVYDLVPGNDPNYYQVDDCKGWKDSSVGRWGAAWFGGTDAQPSRARCDFSLPIICVK